MKERTHNHRLSLLMLLAFLAGSISFAKAQQSPMTLQQCVQYGLTKNAGVLKSKMEIDLADEKRNETRSGYLPQVNGSIQVTDNLKLQHQCRNRCKTGDLRSVIDLWHETDRKKFQSFGNQRSKNRRAINL